MPYIPQNDRKHIDMCLEPLLIAIGSKNLTAENLTAGQLTYILYRIALKHWQTLSAFQIQSDIKGAFQSALDELQRRYFTPYEQKKIHQNGDIT